MIIDPYRAVDPFFDDVRLLLHVTDAPALVEATGIPSIAVVGAGALSNVQAKFGTHSFRNPGTTTENTHYVRATGPSGWFQFPGEVTLEGWFYVTTLVANFMTWIGNNINFSADGYLQLATEAPTGKRLIFNSRFGGGMAGFVLEGTLPGATPLNTWVHLAFTRDASNVARLFLDGVVVGSNTFAGTLGTAATTIDIGRGQAPDNGDFDGYWEEIRVSAVCRYTANFTPPAAPFLP